MTNQAGAGGPPLVQARSSPDHHHNHHRQHRRHHQHRRLHPLAADTASLHIRSPPSEKLHDRQVVIVQTVSVVHYIDGSGAVTSVETLRSDPLTPTAQPDLSVAVTPALSALSDALPSVSLSGLIPTLSDGAPSTTTSAESETSLASLSASTETLTSAPLSSSSAFPTLSRVFNSSSTQVPSLFGNYTVGLFSNSTRTSSSSRSTFVSTSTTSSSLFSTFTSTSSLPTIAAGEAGGSADADAGTPASTAAPVQPTSGTSSGLPPATRNAVVGGVVGSVAGIALIVLVLLYLLKWKKQHDRGIMLLGDGDASARDGRFSSGGPLSPGGGGGKGMMDRSGPFAIPSALAKLSGKRALEPAEPATQEKGFYRVSGRKLISVLESGGDGYSDPHDSVGSGTSYYRDSQAFLDGSSFPPLQLGSPMRPVSGVVTFHDGPQRTAVHEPGPSAPNFRPPAVSTLPVPDALGRSLASRDGSRGSGSRFTEET